MLNATVEKYVETVVITTAAILAGYYASPSDPLLVHAVFPWIWIIPILISLRHGRIAAVISVIIVIMSMLYSMKFLLFSWDAYQAWLFGGVTLTFICAEYNAMWARRQLSLKTQEEYLDGRLESLSRVYGVLRLSHDRLEESLILKPVTLREAFLQLRGMLLEHKGHLSTDIAQKYLELLAYHTNLDKAALYLLEDKQFSMQPIANIRCNDPLNTNDLLIRRTMNNKKTSYIGVNMLEENELSQYLAVVPMKTADEKIVGLLTISDMPFMALNNETLKTLSLLLAYMADETFAAHETSKVQKIYADCPAYFSSELFKLSHMYKIAKIDSAIFAFYILPHIKKADILQLLHQEKRGLDIIWQAKRNDIAIFFILMPLTERSMIKGYMERMQGILKKQGVKLDENPVFVQHRQLSTYLEVYPLLDDLMHYDRF